jgi:hypothetical protein
MDRAATQGTWRDSVGEPSGVGADRTGPIVQVKHRPAVSGMTIAHRVDVGITTKGGRWFSFHASFSCGEAPGCTLAFPPGPVG